MPEVEAGRADYTESHSHETQARLLARHGPGSRAAAAGRQQYFAAPVPAIDALVFNSRRSLFARAAMRRAVNYAIDRRALGQEPFGGRGGRPTDQHIPPGYPGFRDATIYPLGGPDLATARRLAGGARRHGILYTCNLPGCIARAAIVRANLAAIGIELETRQFSIATMHRRLNNPDEPYDLSLFTWGGEAPDPSEFIDVMVSQAAGTGFLDRTASGAAVTRREPARRRRAAAKPTPRWIATSRQRPRPSRRTTATPTRTSSPPASDARSSIRSTASTLRRSASGTDRVATASAAREGSPAPRTPAESHPQSAI